MPALPRRKRRPGRLADDGEGEVYKYFPSSAMDLYRQLYFEAMDLIMSCIRDHCDQKGYQA